MKVAELRRLPGHCRRCGKKLRNVWGKFCSARKCQNYRQREKYRRNKTFRESLKSRRRDDYAYQQKVLGPPKRHCLNCGKRLKSTNPKCNYCVARKCQSAAAQKKYREDAEYRQKQLERANRPPLNLPPKYCMNPDCRKLLRRANAKVCKACGVWMHKWKIDNIPGFKDMLNERRRKRKEELKNFKYPRQKGNPENILPTGKAVGAAPRISFFCPDER